MEIEATLHSKGAKYYGVVRAYGGALQYWGIQGNGSSANYVHKAYIATEIKKIVIKNPNTMVVFFVSGGKDVFKLMPGQLTEQQRSALTAKMPYPVTESKEMSAEELAAKLDRMHYFLSQNQTLVPLITRELGEARATIAGGVYVGGIVLIVCVLVIGFIVATWYTLTKL